MENVLVETREGVKKCPVYNVHDFPYEILNYKYKTCKKSKREYMDIVSTFDIETTTVEDTNISEKPFGFMYQWQFCFIEEVVFGRTWEEFLYFLNQLSDGLQLNKNKRLVIYVHNLSFEFQFIKDFLDIESIFAKDKRKVMKFSCNQAFEFRCSYFLSNMSLAKFCENTEGCVYWKNVDKYDYRKLRTYKTELTNEEKSYCYCDVRGLAECIQAKLEDDNLATIPLTNTGYVRRSYRKVMQTRKNRKQFEKTRLDEHLYTLLVQAFRGGNTHANRHKVNQILSDVYSFDITSSYPSCIMMDDFPIGKFTKVTISSQEELEHNLKNKCCLLDVSFFNISTKYDVVIPYIDIAHCKSKKNIVNDNGRVLKADYVRLTLTEIDLQIIRDTYNYESFSIHECYVARKGKLPSELRNKMLYYYDAKTQLKDVEGKEYEYAKSKNMLNSTFGMMVTAIDHSEIIYNADTMIWDEEKPIIQEALDIFYKSKNSFLSYQWGVWVTANARKRLQRMINKVGIDLVYIDTDSIKFQNTEHIKEFEELNKELELQAKNNDIPATAFNKDGKEFPLGLWDNDGNYLDFKTLGAKKYCYNKLKKDKKTGEEKEVFEITVSGMNKKLGANVVGNIRNFNINTTYENIGRTTSWYNDVKPHKITVNGDTFTTASNIGILDTSYTLGVTNEYWELLCCENLIAI